MSVFANPSVEQMARHWFVSHFANPVLRHLLTLCLTTDVLVGGLENRWIMDSGCSRHMTENDKWFSSLTPTRHKEYIIFGDNGKGKVRGVGAVRVYDRFTLREVDLVSNLGI